MRNVSAWEYMDKIDRNLLTHTGRAEVDDAFARLRLLDKKLIAIKAERRAIADILLAVIVKQAKEEKEKEQNADDRTSQGAQKEERKTLYGLDVVVHNT